MIVSAYTGGLRVVSLVKILRGTQVHLTILEKRTLPASMLAVGHAQLSPLTISLQDLEMYAALALRSRNPQDNLTI